jgi:hypothetical protein
MKYLPISPMPNKRMHTERRYTLLVMMQTLSLSGDAQAVMPLVLGESLSSTLSATLELKKCPFQNARNTLITVKY